MTNGDLILVFRHQAISIPALPGTERGGNTMSTETTMATITASESKLTKRQRRIYGPVLISGFRRRRTPLTAEVRWDDNYGNGHNTFAITGEVRSSGSIIACGCLHEEIGEHFPELKPLLKWHLMSSDGPMHYIENTLFWLGFRGYYSDVPSMTNARNAARWPDMPETFLANHGADVSEVRQALEARLPRLLAEFRTAVESLGFTW